MNYTQSIGNINELKCLTRFVQLGYECSIPYGNGAKYDFVADVNGELLRIQCKSCIHPKRQGIQDTEAISISTVAQTTNTQKTVRHTYSKEQIDYFATSFKDKVYLIPVDQCSTSKTLRFSPPKNNNNNYNNAEDYEIEKFINKSLDLIQSKEQYDKRMAPSIKPVIYSCTKCGALLCEQSKTGLCIDCYRIESRVVVERPSRQELKQMIRTLSFCEIGRRYNVTDNAIRKWCDAEKLPRKSSEIKKYSQEEWSKI